MYSDDYEDEEVEESSSNENFFKKAYNNNKKLIWILVAIIVLLLIASLITRGGSGSTNEDPKEPKLVISNANTAQEVKSGDTISVAVNNTVQLRGIVENYPSASISWESSDPNVLEVSQTGAITGKKLGTAKAKAFYIHTNNESLQFEVNVIVGMGDPNVVVDKVSFSDGDLVMGVNTEKSIELNVSPTNGYITAQEYEISNQSIIRIEDNKVKALSLGAASIDLKINGEYKDTLRVYVVENKAIAEYLINVDRVIFPSSTFKLKTGEIKQIDVTYEPENSSKQAKYLTWESSNTSVATVDKNGRITGLQKGSSIITVTTLSGEESTILVEVEDDIVEVSGIIVNSQTIVMTENGAEPISPTVVPSNASNKSLTFSSSNSSIVSVVPNTEGTMATLYAHTTGNAIVTIRSGNIIKEISVIVNASSSGSGGSSGGSSSGGSSSSSSSKGYSISSSDANGEKFVVNSKSKTNNNAGVGPIVISFSIKNSSTASLKACYYKYGSNPCDPSSTNNLSSNNTLTINEVGTWVINVSEYKSNGSRRRGPDTWYVAIASTSNGGNGSGSDKTDVNANGNDISISGCPTSAIKVGDKVTLTAKTSGSIEKWTHQSNYTDAIMSNNRTTLTVTGKAPGKSTITVYKSGSTDKAVCNITIKENTSKPFSVSWGTLSSGIVNDKTVNIGQATIQNNTNSNSWSLYYCGTSGSSCTISTSATSDNRASIDGTSSSCSVTSVNGKSYKANANYRNNFCAPKGWKICLKAVSANGEIGDLGCKQF